MAAMRCALAIIIIMGDLQIVSGESYSGFESQLNAVKSSCCVIRELTCPSPFDKYFHNTSSHLSIQMESFSDCVCKSRTRCSISFPPTFLPDGSHNVAFSATLVTGLRSSKYNCTYHGAHALVCLYKQPLNTALVSLTSRDSISGPARLLAALTSSGLFGEAMEEAMEHLAESGGLSLLTRPPARNQGCRQCAPFQCAITVVKEKERSGSYRSVTHAGEDGNTADRQRYHQCLRQHSIRPPHKLPSHDSFPETVITNSTGLLPQAPTPAPTTTTITTTETPTQPPTSTTTRGTPRLVTTEERHVGTQVPDDDDEQQTTIGDGLSKETTTFPTTPDEITRTLVAWTSPPTVLKDFQREDDEGGMATEGGGVDIMVVVGVVAAAVVLGACLIFVFLRRRRRSKKREPVTNNTCVIATTQVINGARPLPSVSVANKKLDKGKTNEDDDTREPTLTGAQAQVDRRSVPGAQRYATQSFMMVNGKTSLSLKSSDGNESLYASLDETAMIPSSQPLSLNNEAQHASQSSLRLPTTLGVSSKKSDGLSKLNTGASTKKSHIPSMYYDSKLGEAQTLSNGSLRDSLNSSKYYNLKANLDEPQSLSKNNHELGVAKRTSYEIMSPPSESGSYGYSQPRGHDYYEYVELNDGTSVANDTEQPKMNSKETADASYLNPRGTPKSQRKGQASISSGKPKTRPVPGNINKSELHKQPQVSSRNSGVEGDTSRYQNGRDLQRKLASDMETNQSPAINGDKVHFRRDISKALVSPQRSSSSKQVDQDGYLVPMVPNK